MGTPVRLPRRAVIGITFTVAAMLLAACDPRGGPSATPPPATATAAIRATVPPSVAPDKTAVAAPSPASRIGDEAIAFQTDDGVTIRGHLYEGSGAKRQAVILAHMHGSNQTAWRDFARELAAQGIAALTFDFRGHGETGGQQDLTRVDRDLTSALLLMQSRDYAQIFLIGASLGGMAAAKVGAAQDVAGVVMVGAPVDYMGVSIRADVPRITERKLIVWSRAEPDLFVTSGQELVQIARDPKESLIFEGAAHGTDLLLGANAAQFKDKLIAFILGR